MAVHYAGQLVEYVVLHANNLCLDTILTKIRAVAVAWGPGMKGYDETLVALNMIKEEAWNFSLTPTRVWLLVKSVFHTGKHITQELISFMDNLDHNGILNYLVVFEMPEDKSDLITGNKKAVVFKLKTKFN